MTYENEWIENLGENIELVSSKKYCINTDTLLLAEFSMPKIKENSVLDLGTGCGAIPLFWYSRGYDKKTIAVEIQTEACDQFQRSVRRNNLNDKIKILNIDLKNVKDLISFSPFDLITCNPPYKKISSGEHCKEGFRAKARYELECQIEDIVKVSRHLLNSFGRLCMCNRTERLTDVLVCMRSENIEPKRLQFVQYKTSKPPKLFLVEGKKDAKSGIEVLPNIIIDSK